MHNFTYPRTQISFQSYELLQKSKNPKIQNSKNPKIQKNPFFQNFFEKVKNGHKKVCPKFKLAKKFPKKKNFFYRNKLKNFFQVLRAFSRKITFFAFFPKNPKNRKRCIPKWTFWVKNPKKWVFFCILNGSAHESCGRH